MKETKNSQESVLTKYQESVNPKWWEWIPILSLCYGKRMGKLIKQIPMGDPIREQVGSTFGKAFAYSFGLALIFPLLTPLLNFILNKKVINKMSMQNQKT